MRTKFSSATVLCIMGRAPLSFLYAPRVLCRTFVPLVPTAPFHRAPNQLPLSRKRSAYDRPLFAAAAICSSANSSSSARVAVPSNPDSKDGAVYNEETLLRYVKEKGSVKAVRKIFTALEEAEKGLGPWGEAGIRPDSTVYRTAIRTLLKDGRTDLAIQMYRQRMEASAVRPTMVPCDFPLAANVVKRVLRDCKKRGQKDLHATDIVEEMIKESAAYQADTSNTLDLRGDKMMSSLFSLIVAFLNDGNQKQAKYILSAAATLAQAGERAVAPVGDYNDLIRLFGKNKMLNEVFQVLDMMKQGNVIPNNETFEFLANAAVKQVHFVTGAVSMSTLPSPLGAEVAFAGRSNVGKSSLVNMLCNRKALAYVSGRPGKTQQFNYFLVNEKDPDSRFYIVDMPGVGYAKVPKHLQDAWLEFMQRYFENRTSLHLIFHLVDGRHGALADDEELMAEIAKSRKAKNYVVVLTKMDKMDKQKAKNSVLNKTREALLRNGCAPETPIVLTSANTKLGREELWRQLRSAIGSLSTTDD